MPAQARGVLLVAVSGVAFGLTPFFARAAYAGGADVVSLMVFRFGITAALLWLYLCWRQRAALRLPRGAVVRLLLLGAFGYTAMSTLYYSSVRFISPSLAVLLLYTYPVLVVLEGYLLFGDPVGRRSGLAMVLALAGVVLALGNGLGWFDPRGVMLALGAAAVYSLYIVLSSRMLSTVPPLVVTAWVCTGALGMFGLAAAVGGMPLDLTPGGWAGVLLMTLVGTVLAVSIFFGGMALIGPARTSILSTLEPLATLLVAAAVYGDVMSALQWVGGGLVISSALLVATDQASRRAAPAGADRPAGAHDLPAG